MSMRMKRHLALYSCSSRTGSRRTGAPHGAHDPSVPLLLGEELGHALVGELLDALGKLLGLSGSRFTSSLKISGENAGCLGTGGSRPRSACRRS